MHKFMAFSLGCLLVASPTLSESKPPVSPMALAERDRSVTGGRAVLVELPQSEIDIQVDVGRVVSDAAYGGGLLGALILMSGDDKRATLTEMDNQKAKAHVAPLRQAIRDFDFDKLAMETTRSALSRLDWFAAQDPKSVKSSSEGEREAFANTAGSQQLATITYHYSLSPDFTQILVVADIALWQPVSSRAGETQGTLTALCRQRIVAIAELRTRSYEHSENVAQWSAGNGTLAKASITAALARLERLIPFALGLTQTGINALNGTKSDKLFAAGFYGPPVKTFPSIPGETLIWSQGLIDVMPAPEVSTNAGAS